MSLIAAAGTRESAGMQRVTIIGSECTGKTTLTAWLAKRLGTLWVPEFARAYAEKHATGRLEVEDVELIARGHLEAAREAERQAEARGLTLVIFDTDLLSTVVYARHYYGGCAPWIETTARERLAGLYLLLHPDLAWAPDACRDRGHMRERMHALFVSVLEEFSVRHVDICGTRDERQERAALEIARHMADPRP